MVRIALAQILYKPAIVEQTIDYLAEPGLTLDEGHLCMLHEHITADQSSELQALQNQIRENYIAYIGQKLKEICTSAAKILKADVLVYPEYSVPYQCLPILKELASKLKITIIAGSHTVLSSSADYYEQAGLDPTVSTTFRGVSISPVFFHDRPTDYQVKHHRSIFEMTMQEPEVIDIKRFHTTTRKGESFCFSVIICADSLFPDTLSQFNLDTENGEEGKPFLFTVACSTSTTGFLSAAQLLSIHEIPDLVCNASQYGGTGIYLSNSVKARFTNAPEQTCYLKKSEEALMIVDLSPTNFSVKRGILDNTVFGNRAICHLYYGKNDAWVSDYHETLNSIKINLKEGNVNEAAEHAELFLACNEDYLPETLKTDFQEFLVKCANYCGDSETYLLPLHAVFLNVHRTQAQFSYELKQPLDFCVNIGEIALTQITSLLKQKTAYPEAPTMPLCPIMPDSIIKPTPTDTEVQTFRNRGAYMNQLQDAIADPETKLILVSGAYGIGKTSTVAMTFKRHLPDWIVTPITLPTSISFSMVLEYLANAAGLMLRADTLTRSSKKILAPMLKERVETLFSKDGRAFVVDNMEPILLKPQGRDVTLLKLFREVVQNLGHSYGKLIFISDVSFPKELFPDAPYIKRIVIGRIQDNIYVKRILEYEMRKHKLVSPGNTPEISDFMYDLVSGHPLTAKLCVEVIAQKGPDSISDISPELLQSQIIEKLMQKINLEHAQVELLSLLSVFRSTIDICRLRTCLPEPLLNIFEQHKVNLDKLSFVSTSEHTIELIAVFRKYYYEKIPPENRNPYHEYALKYYEDLLSDLTAENKFSALVYAEITYHLTQLGQMSTLKTYLPGNLDSLKQLARGVYKDKRYDMARQLYSMLQEAYPDDAEVLTYLGRCYARKGQWDLVRQYFTDAIRAAGQKGDDTWYLYRDWGHLYVRYRMDTDAVEKFSMARDLLRRETPRNDDAGILAAEGFMLERDGEIEDAIEKYECALSVHYVHEFTISTYTNLLRRLGQDEAASKLEKRLAVVNSDDTTHCLLPAYDVDFDLWEDLYDE